VVSPYAIAGERIAGMLQERAPAVLAEPEPWL
jgi:hypothetical protein